MKTTRKAVLVYQAGKLYVGVKPTGNREVFRSDIEPTDTTHGYLYSAVIGPFRSRGGADLMAKHGANNPHLQTVEDADRIARENRKLCDRDGL